MKRVRSGSAICALAVITLAIPLIVARHHGAYGAVRGDDWSYLRTLFHWVDTGQLDFNNWVSMTLIGQLVVAAPVAWIRPNSIAALQTLNAVWGFIGIVLVFFVTLRLTHRHSYAFGLALLLGTTPLWGVLSVGFMTDVPALTMAIATIALGIRAVNGTAVASRYLWAAIATAVCAFTVREYAIIPGVAAVIVAVLRTRSDATASPRLRTIVITSLAALITCLAIMAWWRTVPNGKALTPHFPDGHSIRTLFYKGAGIPRLLGLLLLPAIIMAGPVRIVRTAFATQKDSAFFLTVFVTFAFAFSGISGPRIAFAGNYMSPDGALAQSVGRGRRPDLISAPFWNLLVMIGSVGAVLLVIAAFPTAHALFTRIRTRDAEIRDPVAALLGFAVFGYASIYVFAAAVGLPLYDRYAIPLVPIIGILLLRRSQVSDRAERPMRKSSAHRRTRKWAAVGVLVSLMALGYVYTADSASYDGARWDVARATHEKYKIANRDIGGSFEWVNFYAATPGTGVRKREKFCVRVTLLQTKRAPVSALKGVSRMYRPPLHRPMTVAALREAKPCKHSPAIAPFPNMAAAPVSVHSQR